MKTATKKIRNLLSVVLVALLALAPLSLLSFAADEIDLSGATYFAFSDSSVAVTEGSYNGYKVKNTALSITAAGTYVVSGSCSAGTIVIKKNVTGVTLVLDGLTLSASATAPITCNKGSGVTIFAATGSVNTLTDDQYNNDDTYTDETLYPDIENAVIKCKDGSNVTICGSGTINVNANGKNGVKGGYDLYEEDEDGNATDVLLSTSSLTIKDLTLNIVCNANDGLKSDKELNILSGNITVSAIDDAIKCDYVLNIGAEGTNGPTITVKKSAEGIEGATVNVYSGNIYVNATDDGINAANSDLTNYSFSYNQYGGYVYVNVTNGDGIDSNGSVGLMGGTVEVYAPSQGDGDPIDSDGGTTFGGATVLAVGHMGMQQSFIASTPYLTFSGSSGFGGMNGGSNLVSANSAVAIRDSRGNAVYTAKSTAPRAASYVVFASPSLSSGSSYTLYNGSSSSSTATASTSSSAQPGQPGGDQWGGSSGSDAGSSAFSSIFERLSSFFERILAFFRSIFSR